MASKSSINIAIKMPAHKTLRRIASRNGWKMRHAANEAVKALEEKTNQKLTLSPQHTPA